MGMTLKNEDNIDLRAFLDQMASHSTISVSSNGNINATNALFNPTYSQTEELDSAHHLCLKSLQNKRLKRNSNVQRGYLRMKRNNFSMSTLKDQNFAKGISDEFCSHRVIGALSNAEHFGSL